MNVAFTLQASVGGTTLTATVGSVTTSITDSQFATGSVGVLIHSGSTAAHKADNFQATVQ